MNDEFKKGDVVYMLYANFTNISMECYVAVITEVDESYYGYKKISNDGSLSYETYVLYKDRNFFDDEYDLDKSPKYNNYSLFKCFLNVDEFGKYVNYLYKGKGRKIIDLTFKQYSSKEYSGTFNIIYGVEIVGTRITCHVYRIVDESWLKNLMPCFERNENIKSSDILKSTKNNTIFSTNTKDIKKFISDKINADKILNDINSSCSNYLSRWTNN